MPIAELPLPDKPLVYVYAGGERHGPITRRDLRRRLGAGQVRTTDVVWFKGLEGWTKISDAPDLFRDLDSAPAATQAPEERQEEPAAAEPDPEPEPEPVHEEVAQAIEEKPAEAEAAFPRSEEERLDAVFASLVESSWAHQAEQELAGHIDEVLLGAVITSTLERGYCLIDLESDGNYHYLRFESLEDQSRVILRLRHLTGDLARAKVLGQRANAVIGYGEKAKNISKVLSDLKTEQKSGFVEGPEPGTLTVEGDVASGYVYAQVGLYLKIDDYVAADYTIDHSRLADHVAAVTHALRKYVRGRFA